MAVIVLALAGSLCAAVLVRIPRRGRRYAGLLGVGLLSSALVNLAVKGPVGGALSAWAGGGPRLDAQDPAWLLLVALLLAPVTEEAVKLAPLVAPPVRRLVRDRVDALWAGMALGMSFGLGEIVWVAATIAMSPDYAQIPWYAFGGFASERLLVTLGHGVMTALAVTGWFSGCGGRGYLGAVALHAFANIGAFLALVKVWSPGLASAWTVASMVVLAAAFEWLRGRASGEAGRRAAVASGTQPRS
ncbi:hypothetical protein ACQP1U_11365 [Actinomycetota bacterium]